MAPNSESGLGAAADQKREVERLLDMASVAAAMLQLPAGTPASALHDAMGVRDIRHPCGTARVWLCARERPVRTFQGGAKDSAPWRIIILPTCSRYSRECKELLFTVTVKQPASSERHVKHGNEGSTGEHTPLPRD